MTESSETTELDQLTEELKTLLVQACPLEGVAPEDIGDDTPLFGDEGLGLDSLDAVEIVVMLQRNYGVEIKDMQKGESVFRSVRTIAEYVAPRRKQPAQES